MKTALLLSGGIESTILAYEYKPHIAVTINYGQAAAENEIKASKYVCSKLNIQHIIVEVNILKYKSMHEQEWIPFRNQYLLTTSAIILSDHNVKRILIGTINSDKIHPDGTIKFINKINQLFAIEKYKINVQAPYINFTSDDLLQTTTIPLSLLAIAYSCTTANIPCNICNSCKKYYNFFKNYKILKKVN